MTEFHVPAIASGLAIVFSGLGAVSPVSAGPALKSPQQATFLKLLATKETGSGFVLVLGLAIGALPHAYDSLVNSQPLICGTSWALSRLSATQAWSEPYHITCLYDRTTVCMRAGRNNGVTSGTGFL